MLRIRKVNITIDESYLKKWISWASRLRMPDIVKLGKSIKRCLDGIFEAIRSTINSVVLKASTTRSAQHSSVLTCSRQENTGIQSYFSLQVD